jgi:peroxiredoxin
MVVMTATLAVGMISACSGSSQTPSSTPTTTVGIAGGTAEPLEANINESTSQTQTPASQENVPSAPPVFAVESIDGETIRLEDLVGTVPVYVLFVPSTADEIDRTQLSGIQARYETFEGMGAQVVVVVSDLPTRVIELRDELGLKFALIADPLHVVASDWQVFDLDHKGKVSPASFVFDAHGSLIAQLVAAVATDRPSVDEVLSVIEQSLSVGAA